MTKQSLKVNIQKAGILALALLCCGCKGKTVNNAPIGTIEDVYDGRTSITDNKGDIIEIPRTLEDKYPDLKYYAGAEPCRGTYLPAFGKTLVSNEFTVLERNEAYVLLKNEEDGSQFSFGKIYDVHPENNETGLVSDYSTFSVIYPMAEFMGIDAMGNDSLTHFYHTETEDMKNVTIDGKSYQGYLMQGLAGSGYTPKYTLLAVSALDDGDVSFSMMVSDKVERIEEETIPTNKYVLDRYGDKDQTAIYKLFSSPSQIEYKVARKELSVVIPSCLEIKNSDDGFMICEPEGSITPFGLSGARFSEIQGEVNTKTACELFKKQVPGIYSTITANYVNLYFEQEVPFMGVTAQHLYGLLSCEDRGTNIRKTVCGTGRIYFDIYLFTRNGKQYMASFYYSKDLRDEFAKWTEFNSY